jgi:hypothetical protein
MRVADRIVRAAGPGSLIEATEARLRSELIAAATTTRAIATDVAQLAARHDEHATLAAGHAERIDRLEAALAAAEAAAKATTEAAMARQRLTHRVTVILTAAVGCTAAAWHWWAPLASLCGAAWRAVTGAP